MPLREWFTLKCNDVIHLVTFMFLQVQKLQSIISSRATQYNHDTKRKERECTKLKERLNQLLMDKRDKKLGELMIYASDSIKTIPTFMKSPEMTIKSFYCKLW